MYYGNVIYENDEERIYATKMTDDMAAEINASVTGIYAEPDFVFSALEEDDNPSIEDELKKVELEDVVAAANASRDMKESWNIRMVHGNNRTDGCCRAGFQRGFYECLGCGKGGKSG